MGHSYQDASSALASRHRTITVSQYGHVSTGSRMVPPPPQVLPFAFPSTSPALLLLGRGAGAGPAQTLAWVKIPKDSARLATARQSRFRKKASMYAPLLVPKSMKYACSNTSRATRGVQFHTG